MDSGGEEPVPDPWERYRQLIRDDHLAYHAGFAVRSRGRPSDPAVRAAAGLLNNRFRAIASQITAPGADEALMHEAELLLQDFETFRDERCPRDGGDWESVQRACGDLMVCLARLTRGRGRAGEARSWYALAAAAWQELGDQAWADECLLEEAEAALADGSGTDAVLETLDSWISEGPPPVRRAKLLARSARIWLDAGDHAAASQRAGQAADTLNATGFTDPVTVGSAEGAFAAWVQAGHREIAPGLPWLPTQALFAAVATIWELLTGIRYPLGSLPRTQALAALDDLHDLERKLMGQAAAVAREVRQGAIGARDVQTADVPAVTASAADGRSDQDPARLRRELAARQDEARRPGPEQGEAEGPLSRLAVLESAAVQAGDTLAATMAAVEQAAILYRAGRFGQAAAVLDIAQGRLGDGDGLDASRRRALMVMILRQAALVAARQEQFPRLSELCGAAIAEFERGREHVSEPYLQDSYLRDRVMLYQLGVFAAWKLGDHRLALVRADMAKARASLGWAVRAEGVAGTPDSPDVAARREQWASLTTGQDDAGTVARRRAAWTRLVTAQARVRRVPLPDLDLSALQAVLAADEAIIYYYFIHEDTLLIFTITPTAIGAERRVLNGIRGQLDELADGITGLDGEVDWLGRYLPGLGMSLLPRDSAPLLEKTRRLLICPHLVLHSLPLHAMDWQGAPLIQSFAVSYVPNATSLLLARPVLASTAILSVGIDSYPPPLAELPGAEQEAQAIAALYRKSGAQDTLLLGADATRTRINQLQGDGSLGRFSVLHLVTHGMDHPEDEPNAAAVQLADGPVDAMDISQWTLRADLVILSACWSVRRPSRRRTLRGSSPGFRADAAPEELAGDEVYGLQSAFFAAGARQILGALWPLDDVTAPEVMAAFHASLLTSHAPELSLQAAVNQQRTAGRSAYHWAPYKLIALGRPATPALATSTKET